MGGAGAVVIEGQLGKKVFFQPEPKNGDAKTYAPVAQVLLVLFI